MIVNSNIIPEYVRIDENILVLMNNLRDDNPDFDNSEIIKYLKMFIRKEKRLISQIPQDLEILNVFLNNLEDDVKDNINNVDNSKVITSRIFNYLKKCRMKIKPSSQYVHVFNGQEFYVKDNFLEFDYNSKARFYYDNLNVKYLKSLEDLRQLGIYDDASLTKIEDYNLFINRDLFEDYIYNDLSIEKLSLLSDDILCNKLELSEKEFFELKDDVISSMIDNLLYIMLTNPEESLDYFDAKLNFKFYLGELPVSSINKIMVFCESFFKKFFEVSGKNAEFHQNVTSFVYSALKEEIDRKNFVLKDNVLEIKEDDYVKLKLFVNLEIELLELIEKIDLDTPDFNYINKVDNLLRLEDDFVLDFSNYSLIELSNFFSNGLSSILNEDFTGRNFKLISYRLYHRFPVFIYLNKSSSQSIRTYDVINRNYIVSSVKNYYDLIKRIGDEKIKVEFIKLYKEQFYMNPDLTELLVFLNGNHEMIEPFNYNLSCELSEVDEIEYDYDLGDQLFPEICSIIDELCMFDNKFIDADNAYFQFRLLQFNYILELLDLDSLEEALKYLIDNFDNNSIYNILYNLIILNINDYKYVIDIQITDKKTKINILNK